MTKSRIIYLILILLVASAGALAQHAEENPAAEHADEVFEPTVFILDHIADSHEWHILTTPAGKHVSVYLPVILYSKYTGFHIFSSRQFAHGNTYKGFYIATDEEYKGRIAETLKSLNTDSEAAHSEIGHTGESGTEAHPNEPAAVEYLPLDFSVTKNVAAMIVAVLISLSLFISLANSYRRTGISEPRGLQGFLEPVILFVKDDIVIPNVGEHKHEKYLPYLLTVFFFILVNNILGLIPFFPFGANVTGNIAVTFVLAFITFVITQFSGNRNYWKHIFATPGVPFWLLPVMIVVELIGIISKPFALMVRLFANITAGHIIVLALVSIIFIFKTLWIVPGAVVFVLFMDFLELLVAFLQAYVFTLLSALFIGIAVEEEHH